MAKRKSRKRLQREAIEQGKAAILAMDGTEVCPKRGGLPIYPRYCSGCAFNGGSLHLGILCKHQGAKLVQAATLEKARRREKGLDSPQPEQGTLF